MSELDEGGPAPNQPTPEEVLETMRARVEQAHERGRGRMVVLPKPAPVSADEELRTMGEAAKLLSGLDTYAAMRAAAWLFDRFGPPMEDGS